MKFVIRIYCCDRLIKEIITNQSNVEKELEEFTNQLLCTNQITIQIFPIVISKNHEKIAVDLIDLTIAGIKQDIF